MRWVRWCCSLCNAEQRTICDAVGVPGSRSVGHHRQSCCGPSGRTEAPGGLLLLRSGQLLIRLLLGSIIQTERPPRSSFVIVKRRSGSLYINAGGPHLSFFIPSLIYELAYQQMGLLILEPKGLRDSTKVPGEHCASRSEYSMQSADSRDRLNPLHPLSFSCLGTALLEEVSSGQAFVDAKHAPGSDRLSKKMFAARRQCS